METDRRIRLAQPLAGALQLGGVDIQSDQPAGRPDAFEELAGVAAIAHRAIDDDLARRGLQTFHDLFDQDGNVGPGGRIALGPHVGLDLRVGLGIVFLVLLRVVPRVGPAVSHPANPLLLRLIVVIRLVVCIHLRHCCRRDDETQARWLWHAKPGCHAHACVGMAYRPVEHAYASVSMAPCVLGGRHPDQLPNHRSICSVAVFC